MIQTILSFFGYCKIPKEAVEISIASSELIETLLKHAKDGAVKQHTINYIKIALKGQKALTEFLRSGRLLQWSE